MKRINKSSENKINSLKKIVIYIILLISVVYTYISTKETPAPKSNNGFSALYSGEGKTNTSHQPSKLKWFDSFRGIDNSGK